MLSTAPIHIQCRCREDLVDSATRVPDFQWDIVRAQKIFEEFIARGRLDRFHFLGRRLW